MTTIPLSSITLSTNKHPAILSDALLRSCVKRLLVGKTLPAFSGERLLREQTSLEESQFLRKSVELFVEVPTKSLSFEKLEYPLIDAEPLSVRNSREDVYRSPLRGQHRNSYGDALGDADEIDTSRYVILPSTRIIFIKEDSTDKSRQEYERSQPHQDQIRRQQAQQPRQEDPEGPRDAGEAEDPDDSDHPNDPKNSKGVTRLNDPKEEEQERAIKADQPGHDQSVDQNQTIPHGPTLAPRSNIPPHQYILDSLRFISLMADRNAAAKHVIAGASKYESTNVISNMITTPRSFLLTGPPGVGKTYCVKRVIAIANNPSTLSSHSSSSHSSRSSSSFSSSRDAVKLISVRGSELLGMFGGGSYSLASRYLERLFVQTARSCCRGRAGVGAVEIPDQAVNEMPSEIPNMTVNEAEAGPYAAIIFLDECDALVSSSVVSSTLASLLDRMDHAIDEGWERLIVVAATNRIEAIPSNLRRPGRFDKEIALSPPNAEERLTLLRTMLTSAMIDEDSLEQLDLPYVAKIAVGYVPADLAAVVRRAAMLATERNSPIPTTSDLLSALNEIPASSLRDASLSSPPRTAWDDIAGDAGGAIVALRQSIEWPRIHPDAFRSLRISPPRGVLLHGPPGCAKTTLARAAAGAAGAAFISLSPAEVYSSSYVGEAEGVVRRVFDLARGAAPCVLFFDEIDSIVGGQDGGSGYGMSRGNNAEARVLSTFLNEMDGVDGSVQDGVLVLAATNRPMTLDAALLRPGRFDKVIYVPPPDEAGRRAILRKECTKWRDALFAHCSQSKNDSNNDSKSDSKNHSKNHPNSPLSTPIDHLFPIESLASDNVSGNMTGAELIGACRETAMDVMRIILHEHHTELAKNGNDAKQKIHDEAERWMALLNEMLATCLRKKTPLLSDAKALEEYARFDREHR